MLKQEGLKPSRQTNDTEFYTCLFRHDRKNPTSDEVLDFINDGSPSKRAEKIDELIGSKESVDYWTLLWTNWLIVGAAMEMTAVLG